MHRLKLYYTYYKNLLSFSLPFTLLVSFISLAFAENKLIGFINAFSLSLLTGSFILALYFYEKRYQNQYYFYHNQGISKFRLIVGAYLFNVALVLQLFVLKLYLYA